MTGQKMRPIVAQELFGAGKTFLLAGLCVNFGIPWLFPRVAQLAAEDVNRLHERVQSSRFLAGPGEEFSHCQTNTMV